MPLLRHHRRFAAWVTLVALVLVTLAPGVARALAFADGNTRALSQVCSANANPRGDGSEAPSGDVAHLFEHCPFCALQSDSLCPPPAPLHGIEVPALSHALPALCLRAPRPLLAWAAALARAPPSFV